METTLKASAPTTGEAAVQTDVTSTPEKSIPDTLIKQIKDGLLTPEEAIENAFPSPFVHVKEISVDQLSVDPLPTGFSALDQHLFLKKDRAELVVVGAGTSHGKSAFMLQVAANVAKKGRVFVFSLEMDERDIKARLLAPRINVPLQKIMAGGVPSNKLKQANDLFTEMQLYLCTNGKRDINHIRQTALDAAKQIGAPDLVVLDYLQLLRGPNKNTRTAEIADILGAVKELAKALHCPIMIGSQLNRECERRGRKIQIDKGIGDYRPMNADLMDSGSIEHDADVILFISRQFQYDRTRLGEADIVMTKNRGGKVFDAVFEFTGELCAFYESRQVNI